jgi:hypothetical protein
MSAPIDPEAIPAPDLQVGWLLNAASWLRSDADRVRLAGVDIRAGWQGLGAVYHAPEAGQLLSVMEPVRTLTGFFADEVESAAAALERFAQVAGPLASQLQALRADAQAFRWRLSSVDHWDRDEDLVAENNGYLRRVNSGVVAFEAAERDCANAIEALISSRRFHAGGDPKSDRDAYGVESIPDISATPWGAPASTHRSCAQASFTALSSFNIVGDMGSRVHFAEGVVEGAVVGTAELSATMQGFLGWKKFSHTLVSIGALTGAEGADRRDQSLAAAGKSFVGGMSGLGIRIRPPGSSRSTSRRWGSAAVKRQGLLTSPRAPGPQPRPPRSLAPARKPPERRSRPSRSR